MGEIAAVIVAFVFALSAILKLIDRPGTLAGFVELSVPAPATTLWAVIIIELGVAVGVIVVPIVGWVATVLLVVFSAFLAVRLRQGVLASCRCFGAASRRPIGWLSVARNVGLIVVSIIATTATF